MATKPTIATVAVGQKISASLWNAQVFNLGNFLQNKKPVCIANQSTAQTGIVASTFTAITLDNEIVDTDGQHSTVTNNSRIVIGTTLGWYRCSGAIAWATTGGARKGAEVALNGVSSTGAQHFVPPGTTFHSSFLTPTLVQATVSTDYVELRGYSDVAASATAVSGAFRSVFVVEYVADLA